MSTNIKNLSIPEIPADIRPALNKMQAINAFHGSLESAHKVIIHAGVVSIDEATPNLEAFEQLGITLEPVTKKNIGNDAWQALQFLRKQNKEAAKHPLEVRRAVNTSALDNLVVMKLPVNWKLAIVPDSHSCLYNILDESDRIRGEIYLYYLTGGSVEVYPRYRIVAGYMKENGRTIRNVRIVDSADGHEVHRIGYYRSSKDDVLQKHMATAANWLRDHVTDPYDVSANWDLPHNWDELQNWK